MSGGVRRRAAAAALACLLGLSLVACGGDTATDSPAGSSPAGSTPAGGPVDFALVAILTATSAGGTVDPTPTVLATPGDVRRFVAQFGRAGLGRQVRAAVARTVVPDGEVLLGAVVAIGCQAPKEVTVSRVGETLSVLPVPLKPSPVECFAPMTSVALLLVSARDAGISG